MKFDVIVGNPPYQLNSGGFGAQATPIYHFFVEQAKKLKPRYLSFIIPSRWFAGGMGLNQFRDNMLHDHRIKVLYDYPDANDCFPGVEIKGGVSYFIWDREYDGECEVHTVIGDEELLTLKRNLDEYDVFIRWNEAIPILKKIQSRNESTMDEKVLGMNPFNLATNFDGYDQIKNPDKVKIYLRNGKTGYALKTRVQTSYTNLFTKYKVLLAAASEGSGKTPNSVLGKPFISEPGSCSTMTYLVIDSFDNEDEAENLVKYIKTRFFRFLVFLRKNTHHLSKEKFAFVPSLPMDREWTDDKLYERYEITDDERQFIESLVREMA